MPIEEHVVESTVMMTAIFVGAPSHTGVFLGLGEANAWSVRHL
jgi:hypothetical protein